VKNFMSASLSFIYGRVNCCLILTPHIAVVKGLAIAVVIVIAVFDLLA